MTFVFVHGSGGTSDTWHHQLRRFPGAVALDLPGHVGGGAGLTRVGDCAEWVREQIHRRGIADPILVGHSLGGAIVQTCALEFPGELRALGLIGTGARLRVLPAILEGIRANYQAAVHQIIDLAFAPQTDPRLKEQSAAAMLEVAPEVTWGDFYACDQWSAMDRLAEIDVPTLIVCGAEDRLTPVKYSQFLAQQIPGARLVLIEGAGHMVMIEQPEEFNTALAGFLRELGEGIG